MLIFFKKGIVTPKDDKTNIIIPFSVPNGTKSLVVNYRYFPKLVEDEEEALRYLEDGREKYKTDFSFEEFKEVKNLITLSFDENGKYRGACHRQPHRQTVIISDGGSTYGIENRPIEPGQWDVMLNCHFVGCEVKYEIAVEGEVL